MFGAAHRVGLGSNVNGAECVCERVVGFLFILNNYVHNLQSVECCSLIAKHRLYVVVCVNVLADDYTQKLKLNVIKHKLAIINETLFAC